MTADDVPMAALAELLCRQCLDRGRRGDGETARRLLLSVVAQKVDTELLAAASGGVSAAFRSTDDVHAESAGAALDAAYRLLPTALGDTERLLVSVSLALLAKQGLSNRSAADFVAVAMSAQRIDQDHLGRWAAQRALSARADLTPSQETAARLVLALISQDRSDIRRAYALAESLPADDPRAQWARSVRPYLYPAAPESLSSAGDAVRTGDRRAAALSLAREFAETARETGDPLVTAMHRAMVALSQPVVDVRGARKALVDVVGLLRGRQRYGQVPPTVKAGIDMVTDLLHIGATPESVDVLAELLEALADAGLSEISFPDATDDLPATTQARLAEAATRRPAWPDLRACVDGLRGRPALILRRQRMLSTRHGSVLSMYVEPPDSVAIKSTLLKPEDAAVLGAFGRGHPGNVSSTAVDDVERLVRSLLPASLLDRLASQRLPSLVIVPDGELWSVPWQASALLRSTTVSMAPSMSVHARLPPFDGTVHSVTAFVDEELPYADVVVTALEKARAVHGLTVHGLKVSDHTGSEAGEHSDLLLVYAHGSGSGLTFSTGSATRPLSVLRLATTARARAALVAACRSLAAPPVSFPINLPAAMLLQGMSTVVGGLWPLPHESTARIIAEVISGVAAGGRLMPVLAEAREHVPDGYVDRWGLAVHGIV
ncbi:CHAT domain-containing protein [Streptomyces sp. NPDC002888]|uniref:CHAT domain-containing protein n=1 Tax=Streptomyces sp. NPDC002888 TaxID=3364668 RepID=UPI0036C22525